MTRQGHTVTIGSFLSVLLVATVSAAQTPPATPAPPVAPGRGRGTAPPPIVSPEVNADHRVTFRIRAPEAKTVTIGGEFITQANAIQPPVSDMGVGPTPTITMVKGADGVWTGTSTEPIRSGAYRYYFVVDGVTTLDSRNTVMSPQRLSQNSMLVVPGDYSETRNVPHGSVLLQWYTSSTYGGVQRPIWVYTPPGYDKGQGTYPVLYLLHGANDHENSWLTTGRANDVLDNLIAEGKAKAMLLVMPQHLAGPTGVQPAVQGGFVHEFETDIVPWVQKTFRVANNAENRGIAGLSMGGQQTITISMSRPDLFKYVGVFSIGQADANREAFYADKLPKLNKINAWKVHWWAWGKVDFLQANATKTVDYLKSKNVKFTTTKESAGGHDWRNWRDYLNEFAPLLFK
jgi:enterochelin esterase family protein